MDVSVIIPTHNRAHVLPRALDSVLAQTLPPGEIIVVDDGSTDNTPQLIRDEYPQCVNLRQRNNGVSSARNLGVQKARGEWLAFLDSDDAWLPGKLEAQARTLSASPKHRLCHTEEIWIRHGRRVNPMHKHAKHGGFIFRQCLPRCVISPSSVVIHQSVLGQVGLFDPDLPACEDYDLWLRICARFPVAFVAEPQIVKYGGHDDQLSRRFNGMDRFRVHALERILEGETLAQADRVAALETLIEKAGIYALGAEKRGRWQEATDYREKQARYRRELGGATAAPCPVGP